MTVLPIRRAGKPLCRCCRGEGRVPSAEGELRPCSRCDKGGFEQWAERRIPAYPPEAQDKRA